MAGRKMMWYGSEVTVYEHIITQKLWEFFILDNNKDQDVREAIVMGFDTEMGDVSMKEIEPFIITRTVVNEQEPPLMPPPNGKWLD